MLQIVLRLVWATALAAMLIGTFATAADPDQSQSFKFTITSDLEMDISGMKQKIDSDTALLYTWKQRGRERNLIFDSMFVKVHHDGKQLMDTFMSRTKVTNRVEGKLEEVPFEKLPDELKKMLKDSFDVPVCKLQVDQNGKEVKREVVAGPGAKELIDQGMIANALLFHAPFMNAQDEWSVANEISMGNGGFAKGELTYQKGGKGKSGQAVKVTGTLANEALKVPGTPLTIKKAKYVVNGEQTYDPAQREWVSGKLVIDVSFEMIADDKLAASVKGKMVVSLDKLPSNK